MSRGTSLRALRCLAVWLTATLVLVAGLVVAAGPARQLLPPGREQPFEELLVGVCALALLAALGWLWCLTTVTVCQVLGDRPPRRAGATRRLVLLACGAAIASGAVAPAAVADQGDRTTLAGLSVPDRAVSQVVSRPPRPAPATPVAAPDRPAAEDVEVRSGDSLWAIAAAHPVPGESIHDRWRAIWEANEDLIGPDPDLIHPGQRLVLPAGAARDEAVPQAADAPSDHPTEQ